MEYAIARLAVHTNERVLHPAAMLDYRARLRELVAAGSSYEAALLWARLPRSSMLHHPLQMYLTSCRQVSPPIRVVPRVDRGCLRCREVGRIPISAHWHIQSEVGGGGTGDLTECRLGALPWPCRDLVRYAGAGAGKRTLANRPPARPCQSRGPARQAAAAAARSGRYPRAVVEALALRAPGTASVEGTRVRAGAFPRTDEPPRYHGLIGCYGCCWVPLRRASSPCASWVVLPPCAAADVTAPFAWTA